MSKKVTINDIAQIAKTSKTTVSFYLNQKFDKMSDETRERISQAIKETNYKPSVVARSLNAKGTNLMVVKIKFIATKKRIGPKANPCCANDAAIVDNKGANTNWDNESPIPANGPIRAILMLLVSSSGRSFSSITK